MRDYHSCCPMRVVRLVQGQQKIGAIWAWCWLILNAGTEHIGTFCPWRLSSYDSWDFIWLVGGLCCPPATMFASGPEHIYIPADGLITTSQIIVNVTHVAGSMYTSIALSINTLLLLLLLRFALHVLLMAMLLARKQEKPEMKNKWDNDSFNYRNISAVNQGICIKTAMPEAPYSTKVPLLYNRCQRCGKDKFNGFIMRTLGM